MSSSDEDEKLFKFGRHRVKSIRSRATAPLKSSFVPKMSTLAQVGRTGVQLLPKKKKKKSDIWGDSDSDADYGSPASGSDADDGSDEWGGSGGDDDSGGEEHKHDKPPPVQSSPKMAESAAAIAAAYAKAKLESARKRAGTVAPTHDLFSAEPVGSPTSSSDAQKEKTQVIKDFKALDESDITYAQPIWTTHPHYPSDLKNIIAQYQHAGKSVNEMPRADAFKKNRLDDMKTGAARWKSMSDAEKDAYLDNHEERAKMYNLSKARSQSSATTAASSSSKQAAAALPALSAEEVDMANYANMEVSRAFHDVMDEHAARIPDSVDHKSNIIQMHDKTERELFRHRKGRAWELFESRMNKFHSDLDAFTSAPVSKNTPAKSNLPTNFNTPVLLRRSQLLGIPDAELLEEAAHAAKEEKKRLGEAFWKARGKASDGSQLPVLTTPKKVKSDVAQLGKLSRDIDQLSTPPTSRSGTATRSTSEQKPARLKGKKKSGTGRRIKSDDESEGDSEYETAGEAEADDEEEVNEEEDEPPKSASKRKSKADTTLDLHEIEEIRDMSSSEIMGTSRQIKKDGRMSDKNRVVLLQEFLAALKRETGGDGSTRSFDLLLDGTIRYHGEKSNMSYFIAERRINARIKKSQGKK